MADEAEQKQLWEINEVLINENYSKQSQADGAILYTLKTERADLPTSFLSTDWERALDAREEAERQAVSSGREAQGARGVFENPNNYQLQSQKIANNPNLAMLSSSADMAKTRRKGKKDPTT
ncbi:hypothetical protein PT974_00197 [Cladobotryum mycophilum]|uniref:Uncharacterized protein n=1 Tax=Cladobotryum mycophilum TaxID=491253 RepID=A0ABR0T0S2_9HYPO